MLSELFSSTQFDSAVEAAFLLKPAGITVAAWTRAPVSREVISVMAATMWGSLDTMIQTLGGDGPRFALMEIGDRRILEMRVEPNWTLLLVASTAVGKQRLWHEAQRIVERLSRIRERAAPEVATAQMKSEAVP